MAKACMHCYVSGKVQGVWFRAFVKEQAENLGLKGWARNLDDGRVEVLACGDDNQFSTLTAALEKGSAASQVEQVRQETVAWQEVDSFEIR